MALSAYIIKVGHPYEIDLSDPKYNQIKVLWAFVIPTLIITLVAFPFFDYKPRKSYGVFLILVYILFIITSVVLELNHDVEHPDSS